MKHPLVRVTCLANLLVWTACTSDPEQPGVTTASESGTGTTTELPQDTAQPPTTTTDDPTTTTASTTTTTGESSTTETEPPGPLCGDGSVDPGEDCDLGAENSNTGACTLQCHPAVCGDGLVWLAHEECDFGPGNVGTYGGCNPDCTLAARCGDGDVDLGHEECDLAALNGTGMSLGDGTACGNACTWVGRIAFVTSESYDGALGGLSGADLKCVLAALRAGIANATTFRAWLSDGLDSPATRFEQVDLAGVPYILLNGRVLADDFAELVALGPRTGIAITETGEAVFQQFVWTNTSAFGEVFDPMNHCADWLSASGQLSTRTGVNALPVENGPAWDAWRDERQYTTVTNRACNTPLRLYCFEDGYVEEDDR